MAAGAKVQFHGLKELRKELRDAPKELRKELRTAHKQAAEIVSDDARTLVPVRSGRLRRSITPQATATGGQVKAGTASVRYAGVIHFGSPVRGILPRPFLYDAADRRANDVRERFERAVNKVTAQIGGR